MRKPTAASLTEIVSRDPASHDGHADHSSRDRSSHQQGGDPEPQVARPDTREDPPLPAGVQMSHPSEREHERFRALLRRAATEDFRLLHPNRDEDWLGLTPERPAPSTNGQT